MFKFSDEFINLINDPELKLAGAISPTYSPCTIEDAIECFNTCDIDRIIDEVLYKKIAEECDPYDERARNELKEKYQLVRDVMSDDFMDLVTYLDAHHEAGAKMDKDLEAKTIELFENFFKPYEIPDDRDNLVQYLVYLDDVIARNCEASDDNKAVMEEYKQYMKSLLECAEKSQPKQTSPLG